MVYATETEVRLQHGFHSEELFSDTEAVGSTLTLANQAYNVIELLKNGAVLTDPADFSFTPSRSINLVVPGISSDEFVATYGTIVRADVIDNNIVWATQIIKSKLLNRAFNQETLDDWDASTPELIERIAVELAGLRTERAMLRKARSFDPDVMNGLNKQIDELCDTIEDIATGDLEVPDEEKDTAVALVARGGSFVFADKQTINRVDKVGLDRGLNTDGRRLRNLERGL